MARIYDVAVIGAGHNGLIAASYLAKAGLSVGVFERRDRPGGSAVNREMENGFSFFEGAHVIQGFNPAVVRDLALVRHGLEVIPVLGRATFGENGSTLSILRDERDKTAPIAHLSPLDAQAFSHFAVNLEKQQRMVSALHRNMAELGKADRSSGRDAMDRYIKVLSEFGEDAIYEITRFWLASCAEYLDGFFELDIVKAHLAGPAFIGMPKGPMSAATAFLMLRHEINRAGTGINGYVRGGMSKLSEALEQAALKAGCEIHCNSQVVEITARRNRITGIVLNDGTVVEAQTVVSNLDYKRTFLTLFDWNGLPEDVVMNARNYRMKGTLAKMNIALGGIPKFPELNENVAVLGGNLQFTGSLWEMERAFDDWTDQAVPKRPYIEGMFPTAFDPELAPADKHILSLYVQYIPKKLLTGNWDDKQKAQLAKTVISTIAGHSPDFANLIEGWSLTLPGELEDRFFLTEGDIYHGELLLDQVLFQPTKVSRQNIRTGVSGLYVCGSGADIEGGLTGDAGLSTAQQVIQETKRANRGHAFA